MLGRLTVILREIISRTTSLFPGGLLSSEGSVWKRGEREAERFLRRRGCRLLGRNVRTSVGEIDLLFEDADRKTLMIVEVKARITESLGPGGPPSERLPERSITQAKARKLVLLGESVLRMPRFTDRPLRIDVVAVEFGEGGRTEVRHYRNAIDRSGRRR